MKLRWPDASVIAIAIICGAIAFWLSRLDQQPQRIEGEMPGCIILGVVHVNDAPLLYKDCDGSIIREWLWVENEGGQ